ncbi:FAD-binding oxidoreductase [Herbidospora galbida]|uniref:FAD-binding oxidoreductase n=1 Tax=Herbidospora galbida TaxID=2575442 RepID=A0A4U3MIA6_9ACTN|nr:FAD-binding oxidoreductase [Herbidospora galbida]TKK89218.1 FAD-binding oxidoreductase [Herbidospora galbida]
MTTARPLTGWGRVAPTNARVLTGADDTTLAAAVREAGPRGVLARGAGRAYGDAAQNSGGVVADMTHRNRILHLDEVGGVVHAEAGVTVDALLRAVVPRGWCLPVVPGSAHVTVGGAIAADVHGKNHRHGGAFGGHVLAFDLLTADGQVRQVRPAAEPEIFWATLGGMGLTGIVLRAALRLVRLRTAWATVVQRRITGLDALLTGLDTAQGPDEHVVARIDLSGPRVRGVLSHARPAATADVPPRHRAQPLAYVASRPLPCPPLPGALLSKPTTLAAANGVLRVAAPPVTTRVLPLAAFLFPLDRIVAWNRVYGRHGFVQHQFVVPPDALDVLGAALRVLAAGPGGVPLAVLKRLGPGDAGLLSFPMDGWTLAADMPAAPSLAPLLGRLDDLVARAGGRVYLAKDSSLSARHMARMYPRLPEFREIRRTLDPQGVFRSDLARRLSL